MWYEVNTRINHGRGGGLGIKPNDWRYQHMHMGDWEKRFGIEQNARWVTTHVKVMQNCEAWDQGTFGVPKTWYQRPGHCNLPTTHTTFGVGAREGLNSYKSGLGDKAYTLMWQGYVEFMMYKYSPQDFDASNVDQNWSRQSGEKGWEPQSFDPDLSDPTYGASRTPSHYMQALNRYANWGMRPTLIDSAAVWLDAMNPDPKWDDYKCKDNGGSLDCSVSSISQRIQLNQGWNFVSSRVAPSDPSIDQVFAGVNGLSTVKDAYGQAYLPQLGVNQIGTWSTSEGYKVHVEETQETTFTGGPVERDTPIDLKEGWNLLPYYPGDPMDAATALAPIADAVKVVRDEDGNEYVPSQGTNDIGDLVPGDAYAVYVVTDTTLVYPNP
jgi:hypothetical protein